MQLRTMYSALICSAITFFAMSATAEPDAVEPLFTPVNGLNQINQESHQFLSVGTESPVGTESRVGTESQVGTDLLVNHPSEKKKRRLRLNPNVLSLETQAISLPINEKLTIILDKQTAMQNSQGSLVWKGLKRPKSSANIYTQTEQRQNESILIKRAKGITGSLRVDGKLFRITPIGNGLHDIIEMDESKMPEDHPPAEMQILEQNYVPSVMFDLQQNTNESTGDFLPMASANAPDIKVLVAYTSAANSAVADIQGLIELAVAETNAGYANSDVDATMTLVHTYQVNYNESNFSTDLAYFRNQNDGVMDEVHGKRDQYGADIAILMTNVTDYCGLASAIGATSATAFAAVYHGCATGYYSFAHEVGHLQAARHNPEADPNNSPYAFGHGYRYSTGGWRTVMAYNCSPSCSRINWWSNPNKTRNGAAMGTSSTHDNARVLNLTAATMAGFKGGTTPPPSNELTNGVAKTGLSGGQGAQLNYEMSVPSGATNLSFEIYGGSGDADLYVKFGSAPTLNSYDCRPWLNGNNESCDISNPQTGTYYVMINGYSSFSSLNLLGSFIEGGGVGGYFENTSNYNIPDNNSTGIQSPISVTRSGSSGTISIDVDIVHTYKGDLIVDLIHPDGTVYNLHNRQGGSANNINQTYSVNVGSKDSAGTWNLRVRDRARRDTGYIDAWSITF